MTSINFYERDTVIKRIKDNLDQINRNYFKGAYGILYITDNGDYITIKGQGVPIADYDAQKLFDALENFSEEDREFLFPYGLWDYLDHYKYTPENQESDNNVDMLLSEPVVSTLSKLVDELEQKNKQLKESIKSLAFKSAGIVSEKTHLYKYIKQLQEEYQKLKREDEQLFEQLTDLSETVTQLCVRVYKLEKQNKPETKLEPKPAVKKQPKFKLPENFADYQQECDDLIIEMVEVPSSQEISSFAIGKYPITQEQYEAVMGINPSYFQNNPQNPVEMVSWEDAQAFCIKLNGMTGHKYRLPTQEEWEYACRAGTTTDYYFGDDANQLGNYAWYEDNSGLITFPVGAAKSPNAWLITHPVGQKLPNAWGLYDMSGNVWEWCIDKWLRGGSWNDLPYCCRSANRDSSPPSGLRFNNVGFRVAQTIRPTLLAEEMWEAQLSEPYKDMILSEVVEYLETMQTKGEKEKFITAIYWSGFQACLDD